MERTAKRDSLTPRVTPRNIVLLVSLAAVGLFVYLAIGYAALAVAAGVHEGAGDRCQRAVGLTARHSQLSVDLSFSPLGWKCTYYWPDGSVTVKVIDL